MAIRHEIPVEFGGNSFTVSVNSRGAVRGVLVHAGRGSYSLHKMYWDQYHFVRGVEDELRAAKAFSKPKRKRRAKK